jgi:hypothetical protein
MNAHLTAAMWLPVAALPACTTITPGELEPGLPREVRGHAIAARQIHEECAKLRPGDVLDYRFESTAALDFNIHYHEGKVVVMPISRQNVKTDAGVFRPLSEQDYCLMWETGEAAASLDYRLVLRPGRGR